MIENECVRALNYAAFRPSLHELKCNSRTSLYMWHICFFRQVMLLYVKLQARSVANYSIYNIYNIQPVRVFICHYIIWSKVFFNMVKHLR